MQPAVASYSVRSSSLCPRLLERLRAGDRDAGADLWRLLEVRLRPTANRLARRAAGLGLEAEDLLQEAALRLLRANVPPAAIDVVAYLRRVMCNALIDQARRGGADGGELLEDVHACVRTPDPLEVVESEERRALVRELLAELGPRLAGAAWAAYAEDIRWSEVAARGGWAGEDSARVAVARGLQRVRASLAIRGLSAEGLVA